MGVSAINVEAMPASVYCTAMSEMETPTNGPKTVVPKERLPCTFFSY